MIMIKKIIMWIMILTFLNLVIAPEFASAGDSVSEGSNAIGTTWEVIGAAAVGIFVIAVVVILIKKATGSKSSEEKNKNTKLASNNSVPKVYEERDNLVTQSGEITVIRW
jgi:ABC-type dipeptide/oligopeptide/nickel transport system permease subunit